MATLQKPIIRRPARVVDIGGETKVSPPVTKAAEVVTPKFLAGDQFEGSQIVDAPAVAPSPVDETIDKYRQIREAFKPDPAETRERIIQRAKLFQELVPDTQSRALEEARDMQIYSSLGALIPAALSAMSPDPDTSDALLSGANTFYSKGQSAAKDMAAVAGKQTGMADIIRDALKSEGNDDQMMRTILGGSLNMERLEKTIQAGVKKQEDQQNFVAGQNDKKIETQKQLKQLSLAQQRDLFLASLGEKRRAETVKLAEKLRTPIQTMKDTADAFNMLVESIPGGLEGKGDIPGASRKTGLLSKYAMGIGLSPEEQEFRTRVQTFLTPLRTADFGKAQTGPELANLAERMQDATTPEGFRIAMRTFRKKLDTERANLLSSASPDVVGLLKVEGRLPDLSSEATLGPKGSKQRQPPPPVESAEEAKKQRELEKKNKFKSKSNADLLKLSESL
jgi:hypothetical protein